MKKTIGWFAVFSLLVSLTLTGWLNSNYEDTATRFLLLMAAAFSLGCLATSGSIWLVWHYRIEKRWLQLAATKPDNRSQNISQLRVIENERLREKAERTA